MLNKIKKWLSKKDIIKLRVIEGNKRFYCPLCLSDIDKVARGPTTRCQKCNTKIYFY